MQAAFESPRDAIAASRSAGVLPETVRIDNEVIRGMTRPDDELPDRRDDLAEPAKAGIRGVEAGGWHGPLPGLLIHEARGGTRASFDRLDPSPAADVIGRSYDPGWHGSVLGLRAPRVPVRRERGGDILLAEESDRRRPTESRGRAVPGIPEGRRAFPEGVNRPVHATPGGRGIGVLRWEPAVSGPPGSRGDFDDDRAPPVLRVFDRSARRGASGRTLPG